MVKFTLHSSYSKNNPKDMNYAKTVVVSDRRSFLGAITFDHVMATFTAPNVRRKDCFISSNVLFGDIDNSHSEDPVDWITLESIKSAFGKINCFIATSKSHMIEKDGLAARPKFHLYFPLDRDINSIDEFEGLLKTLMTAYDFLHFDAACKDASRFFGATIPTTNVNIFTGESIESILKKVVLLKNDEFVNYDINSVIPVREKKSNKVPLFNELSGLSDGRKNAIFRMACSGKARGLTVQEIIEECKDLRNTFSGSQSPITNDFIELQVKKVELNSHIERGQKMKYEPTTKKTEEKEVESTNSFFKNKFVKLSIGGRVVLHKIGQDIGKAFSVKDFLNAYQSKTEKRKVITVKHDADNNAINVEKVVNVKLAEEFLKQTDILEYDFAPNKPKYFTNDFGDQCFNAFNGFPFANKPADKTKGEVILAFIKEAIAGGDQKIYDFIIDYLAYKRQKPESKVGKIIAMRSEQGAGKTKFFEILSKLFGEEYSITIRTADELTSGFNGHYQNKFWGYLDEVVWGGNRGGKDMLKSYTNDVWQYHYKGKTPFNSKNYTDFIMSTNNDWAAPVEAGDRRYLVLDVVKLEQSRYKELVDSMSSTGMAYLDSFLLKREITIDFKDDNCIPTTKAKAENLLDGLTPIQSSFISYVYDDIWGIECKTELTSAELQYQLKTLTDYKYKMDGQMRSLYKFFPKTLERRTKKVDGKIIRIVEIKKENLLLDLNSKRGGESITEDMLFNN